MTNTEWLLVENAKQGNAQAFAALYQKYYKDLYHFALSCLRREPEAEDAVANAVLKAYEKLHALRRSSSFKSWIFRIVANECSEQLRHRSVYLADNEIAEPLAPEEGFSRSEVASLLGTLPDRERLILTLSVFSGYNSREIASMLHLREGTVRSCKSRALASLRSTMGARAYRKENAYES